MSSSNNFVISVLVDGQVQKELANGEVHIPFGEYSIRFRNKNNRRAVAKLYIDGERMCRGGFVLPCNSHRDIDCSSQTLRKFKFVDLQSTEAQDYGKDQVNAEKKMGLIEVHFHLEKEYPSVSEIHHHHHHSYPIWRHPSWFGYSVSTISNKSHDAPDFGVELCSAPGGSNVRKREYKEIAAPIKDGATVEGNLSSMRFRDIPFQYEDASTTLKLYLRGYEGLVPEVIEPLLESYCKKCGIQVSNEFNFCGVCGSKLS